MSPLTPKHSVTKGRDLVAVQDIEGRIYTVRGLKVMLDADLAEIYGVETKALNRAVRRNLERFPQSFMFKLTPEEWQSLRCQIGTSNEGRGGRRYLPYVFTEYGAVMLASVLNTPIAIAASVRVVETFVRLRQMAGTVKELAGKLAALEKKYDRQFAGVFDAIRRLMEPPQKARYQKGGTGFETKK